MNLPPPGNTSKGYATNIKKQQRIDFTLSISNNSFKLKIHFQEFYLNFKWLFICKNFTPYCVGIWKCDIYLRLQI